MDDDDDVVAGLAQEAQQAQAQLVGGGERMRTDLRVGHALGRVERDLALERRHLRHPGGAVGLPQAAQEIFAEALHALHALGESAAARADRRQLLQEIHRFDAQNPHGLDPRRSLGRSFDMPAEDVDE